MIRPDTGSRWKVSGSSIAMVAIGPMPGSTPISVPISAPASAKAEIGRRHRDAQNPSREVVEELHLPQSGQTGIVKPSPRMKIAHDSAISTSAASSAPTA